MLIDAEWIGTRKQQLFYETSPNNAAASIVCRIFLYNNILYEWILSESVLSYHLNILSILRKYRSKIVNEKK